ncbi:tetratricopeptide repeat protein [Streptomyces sp. NPDC050161]|uniref:tetratricopeptide repeat protein n=1 Tax=Streptomyces sp. NPDC050161 TaxID=3365604 RepID=UPI0037BB078A
MAAVARIAAHRPVVAAWEKAADGTSATLRELALALHARAVDDPAVRQALNDWLRRHAPRPDAAPQYTNTLAGQAQVYGSSVQAREIRGGVHIHQPVTAAIPVPRQLPPVRPELIGREADLRALEDLRGTARLVVVSGLAGVGKTALVSRWLRRCADDYPDGHLYADLSGHLLDHPDVPDGAPADDATGPAAPVGPVSAADVLSGFLQALGVTAVPADTAQRVALWRSLTSGLRLAVLLDNAATAAQVRPLLPGASDSLTIVTSRNQLTGLVVDGAAVHRLSALAPESAVELLATGGGARVAQSPVAAREVVALCACLPLAVCLAAAQLAFRPHRSLSSLADSLSQGQGVLDALRMDGRAVVRTALDATYALLPPDAAALYRTMGLLPADRYDLFMLTAVGELPYAGTERALSALVEANLVEETGPGTYRLHDLIRSHARRRGDSQEDAPAHERTLRRFVGWCLRTATAAEGILTPAHRTLPRDFGAPDIAPSPLSGPADALAWLDGQRTGLMGAVRHCARVEWHTACWQLVDAMWPWFVRVRNSDAWIEAHELALAAARSAGDRAGEGRMLTSGAIGLRDAERHPEAIRWFTEALEHATADGDVRQQAQALNGIGHVCLRAGQLDAAREHFTRSLHLRESAGYRRGAALTRIRLGETALACDRHDDAAEYFAAAHTALEAENETYEAARALAFLGHAETCRGNHVSGTPRLRAALQIFREPDTLSRHWQGRCLEWLGQSAQQRADATEAVRCYTAARDLYRLVSPSDTERLDGRLRQL